MNKKTYISAVSVFILNMIITLFGLTMTILSIIVIQALPPFIIFLLFDICFGALTYHYYRCFGYLRKKIKLEEKSLKIIHAINAMVLGMSAFGLLPAIIMVVFPTLLAGRFVFEWFQITFLIVAIISVIYLVATIWIEDGLRDAKTKC